MLSLWHNLLIRLCVKYSPLTLFIMPSLKLYFRASAAEQGEGTLFFRVIHRRSVATVNTYVKISAEEWDASGGCITGPRKEALAPAIEKVRLRLERIIAICEQEGGDYSVRKVVEAYQDTDSVVGLISFGRAVAKECDSTGRQSAATHYRTAISRFASFIGDEEISFDKVDTPLICRYEAALAGEGLCRNTTSYYMRKLRAVYNMAVARKLTEQSHPFRKVYTGVAKTAKRAVVVETLRSLKGMPLPDESGAAMARDMFLFSFYTRGMSVIDMAYLKKTDLKGGVLTYRRKKTGQEICIRWESAMQAIADRYSNDKSPYLLPLISIAGKNERRQYLSAAHKINRHLKTLGERLGLTRPLTMYVARHTWASVARDRDVPLGVISEGMGHDSDRTTRIYLAALDGGRVDRANLELIGLV